MDRDDPLGRDVGPPPADDAGPIKQNIIIVKNINVLTHGIQQAPYVAGAGSESNEQQQQSSSHSGDSVGQVSHEQQSDGIDRDDSSSSSGSSGSFAGSSGSFSGSSGSFSGSQ